MNHRDAGREHGLALAGPQGTCDRQAGSRSTRDALPNTWTVFGFAMRDRIFTASGQDASQQGRSTDLVFAVVEPTHLAPVKPGGFLAPQADPRPSYQGGNDILKCPRIG